MPRVDIVKSVSIKRTPRVQQLEGLFDIPPAKESQVRWQVQLPIEGFLWNIGLIVGPSGSGKTTIARRLFAKSLVGDFSWPRDKAVIDGFPKEMPIKEVVQLLSSVGFSSPPNWLRPFHVLSNGEQFRCTVARALAEKPALCVLDEFTSVVDRQVAKIASAAIAKAVRLRMGKLIAVTCHYDVIDWLDPDWIYEPAVNRFRRRSLHGRPKINLDIRRCQRTLWKWFAPHHYLSRELCRVCTQCFCGEVDDRPATFTAVMTFPHAIRPGYREHRTVCLPDFQGVGLGNAMSEFVAGCYRAKGKPYRSITGNPAMIGHRMRSPFWKTVRPPGLMPHYWTGSTNKSGLLKVDTQKDTAALDRITATFEYVGPARPDDAKALGIL